MTATDTVRVEKAGDMDGAVAAAAVGGGEECVVAQQARRLDMLLQMARCHGSSSHVGRQRSLASKARSACADW
jgi:hypothetical protein